MSSRLGYFISPVKSQLLPSQRIIHLGFGIDSSDSTYFLPDRRRNKIVALRERLLSSGAATLHDLQSFIGKCQSLRLIFSAPSLFTRLLCSSLSTFSDIPSALSPAHLDEIRFWRFVDSFTDPVPWRLERHVVLRLSADASGYAWGAVLESADGPVVLHDYFDRDLVQSRDICLKESLALFFALQSFFHLLWDRRVDAMIDNEGLCRAWAGLRASSIPLSSVLRSVFLSMLAVNASLNLIWIPSAANPADSPSRQLSRSDSMLAPRLRHLIWRHYGPFSFDLMALPSNVFRTPSGSPLAFFSPFPVPSSAGVNVFDNVVLRAFYTFFLHLSWLLIFYGCFWSGVTLMLLWCCPCVRHFHIGGVFFKDTSSVR